MKRRFPLHLIVGVRMATLNSYVIRAGVRPVTPEEADASANAREKLY